ncbi:MAG: hypothetical protein ACK5BB_08725, partial [Burkholderiaceae bacterium]
DEQHIIEGECFLDQTHSKSYGRKSELYRNSPPLPDEERRSQKRMAQRGRPWIPAFAGMT